MHCRQRTAVTKVLRAGLCELYWGTAEGASVEMHGVEQEGNSKLSEVGWSAGESRPHRPVRPLTLIGKEPSK